MYEQMHGCFDDLLIVLMTEIPLEVPAKDLGPFLGFFTVQAEYSDPLSESGQL